MGVFVILAASQASPAPDPDTHIHVHMDAEDSKGGKSPKTGGGVLASNSSGDYGHWPPRPCGCPVCPCRCHSHCMPHCLPTCRPCPCSTCPCPRPPVWNRRTAIGEGEDYGHWPPKPPCGCPTCPCPPRPCGCSVCPCPPVTWHGRK